MGKETETKSTCTPLVDIRAIKESAEPKEGNSESV